MGSTDSVDPSWIIALHQKILPLIPKVFLNSHPAYENLMVSYNPENLSTSEVRRLLEQEILALASAFISTSSSELSSSNTANKPPLKILPVVYGGSEGPDLFELSKSLNRSEAEIIDLHSQAIYEVAFLGFAPGFPYLKGLAEDLHCPRKSTPRLKVPAGSVGLAGRQTGVYPHKSPGGWQLIGKTPVKLFDPTLQEPSFLNPGDRLRFEASENLNFDSESLIISHELEPSQAHLEILSPGFLSSVQDLGRPGFAHLGVSMGGAADVFALQEGNRLLRNTGNSAAIEMTATGAALRFLKPSWGCITGSHCSPRHNGQEIAMWTTYSFGAGDTLQIGNIELGLRCYFCIQGGFDVPLVLGSRSTFLAAAWGGLNGRALKAGDLLKVDHQTTSKGFQRSALKIRDAYSAAVTAVTATRGPQWHWFTKDSQEAMTSCEFEVTTDCNRLGLRLQGLKIERNADFLARELPTEGVANGSIQITPAGQAMILFCEQQTTGGYPKIACLRYSELSKLGQLRPGQKLRIHAD